MGRQTKKFTILIMGLVAALLLIGLLPQPAWADPPAPTNLQIESARVCRHVIEQDDFVLVFHYNIYYATGQPDDPANKLFTFRLLDTDGATHLGAIVPYAYHNSGYDQGCASFYFPAAEAPTWELGYVLRISGNPEYFGSPPLTSYTLVNSDYSQMETQEENQTVLGNYLLDVARQLEINWDIVLLYSGDLGTMLNATGETYFRGAIPGLQMMAPQIFPVQTITPEYEETDWTETQAEAYKERFANTWIGKALQSLGDLFRVEWNVITGIFLMGVMVAMAGWCQLKYGNIKPVPTSGTCLMLGGTIMGWWSPAIMAIITIMIGGLFLGYVWMFRHG